jgi:pimeloyl-ACP methyl ester carboxylesterase
LARTLARLAIRTSFFPDTAPVGFWERELAISVATPEVQRSCVRVNDGDPTRQLHQQASRISVPVLAIHGRDDRLVPIEYGRRLFDLLAHRHPRNRFEVVDGGHMVHLSRPEAVHAVLERWLN